MQTPLDKQLQQVIKARGIPGASVAILRGKRITTASVAGVINLNTQVKTTTDTIFQIGSITKTFTATIIMQLRDEGRLTLDDTILKHLPKFRIADMQLLQKINIRHLLTHSSGIDGDFFIDTDDGDQAIAQLLEKAALIPSLFEPGSQFSYCNLGFAILGRIIEVLDRTSFDDALAKRIFRPLNMNNALSKSVDNVRFRVAVGHVPAAKKPHNLVVPRKNFLSLGMKSAGSTPAMSATDLLKFAAAHFHNGKALNGTQLLSKKTALEMRKLYEACGNRKKLDSRIQFGLSWIMYKWGQDKVFGHDGGTVGQYSQLLMCPEKNIAVAMLTNGGDAQGAFRDIVADILAKKAKIKVPPLPESKAEQKVRTNDFIGVYENILYRLEVIESKGELLLSVSSKLPDMEGDNFERRPLAFTAKRFAINDNILFEFGGDTNQPAPWLKMGLRLFKRTQ